MRAHHVAVAIAMVAAGCFDLDFSGSGSWSRSEPEGCGSDPCSPHEPGLISTPENPPVVSDAGELELEGMFCSSMDVACEGLATGSTVRVAVPFDDDRNVHRRLWTSDAEVIEVGDPSFDCLAVRGTLVAHHPGTAQISLVRAIDREPVVLDSFSLRVDHLDHIDIQPVPDVGVEPLAVGEWQLYGPTMRAADGTLLATSDTITWRTSDPAVLVIGADFSGRIVKVDAVGPGVADLIAETETVSGALTIAVE